VVVYAYAVFLGACYLFAFWRPIGFNVFPYLGLRDYVSAPLNRVGVLVSLPLIFGAVFFGGHRMDGNKLERNAMFSFVILYGIWFLQEFCKGISRYLSIDFHFANESTAIIAAALTFGAAIVVTIYCYRSSAGLSTQITALVLVQASSSIAAGYSDGKAIYNGAMEVYFLENKELCEPGAVRDWVFLSTFGSQTFFMNTIDKRLCITDEKKMRLVSRQLRETLKP
jgi:hypothetical protein